MSTFQPKQTARELSPLGKLSVRTPLRGRYVPVHVASHSVEPAGVRCLPDRPRSCTEAWLRADAAKPQRTVEGCADPITFVEPPGEIKNGRLSITGFHDPQEIAKFSLDFRLRKTAAAVTGKLEIYGWRQGCRVERHGTHEIRRLCSPAAADPEEMVGASADARLMRSVPIDREPPVNVVCAFGGLDIGKVDALAGQFRPRDLPLMVGDIDALIWVSSL